MTDQTKARALVEQALTTHSSDKRAAFLLDALADALVTALDRAEKVEIARLRETEPALSEDARIMQKRIGSTPFPNDLQGLADDAHVLIARQAFRIADLERQATSDIFATEQAAEIERLRDSLVGIKRAATARMSARENCKHSYYFHTASAALEVKP